MINFSGIAVAIGIAFLASAAHAASLPADWRNNAVPSVKIADGPELTFDQPLGEFDRRSSVVEFAPASLADIGRGAGTIRGRCWSTLDTDMVLRAVTSVFRANSLKIKAQMSNDRYVLIYSVPVVSANMATIYSYVAEIIECVDKCRLRISTNVINAPVRASVIMLREGQYVEDAITAALYRAVDPTVAGRCRR